MFEGRNSRDDDLMRDGQINGRIDGDRDRERDRPRGLEEQRWCSVALGHDTLQTHTHTHTCFVSYSQLKAGRNTADLQLRTLFPVKQWYMVQSTVKGTQHE